MHTSSLLNGWLLFWLVSGTGAVSTPSQPATGDGIANDSISQHQARLKAAAAAASIYERSFVYPSANTLVWYALSLFYSYALLLLMACVSCLLSLALY